ncbi:peptidase associated/transthyretin-like domain-containing protein [Acaryochloris marina]|uniref:dioxygenase n=1 Tax=Acaryochloris marina TaxID=155978 RepID=UPI0021C3C5CF|nr:dioxygenase [Acaryochloris marina]BDM82887.1 hypothetical protein AM10699_57480 [Acaryochloris marina MBIC10699]
MSKLYFRETVSNQIFTQSPYNIREQSRIRNDQDGIFRNGGDQLIMELTHDSATGAYAGIFNVGLELR